MAWQPFRNLGLKAAALALGTLLWFTVSGQQVERRLSVPVFYRNLPPTLEMSSDSLDVVTVQVRGGDNVIGAVQPGRDLFMVVDLADTRSGTNVLPLRIDQVTVSLGIKVLQVDPGTVTLTLERSGTARVPIKAALEGGTAEGFAITSVTVEPPSAEIIGPEMRLGDVTQAITERVLVEGRTATFSQEVSVGVADAQVRLAQSVTARVTVAIGPAPAGQRMFEGIPLEFRRTAPGQHPIADPQGVTLVVRGTPGGLSTFNASMLRPFVYIDGLGVGSYKLPVRLDLPTGVTLVSVQPATVAVHIR
jgi:YbbR domain-containing protein